MRHWFKHNGECHGSSSSIYFALRPLSSLQAATAGQWIPRRDAGREGDIAFASAPIPHARHLHSHWTNAGHHLAFREVTMTDQARAPIFEFLPGKGVHECDQFRVDRLFD